MSETAFVATEGEGVPPGTYKAELVDFEDFDENSAAYGPGIRCVYKVLRGKHKDENASRIFSRKFSKKANLRKFAEVLARRPLENGESFDLQNYLGLPGTIVVAETDSGAYRVETFLPDFDAWEASAEVEDDEIEDDDLDDDDLDDDDLDEEEPPARRKPKKKTARRKRQ